MSTEEKPQFEHDCKDCTFLGRFEMQHGPTLPMEPCDLYVCGVSVIDTVIARYASEGSHYVSGLIFATRNLIPSLVEALKRAQAKGYRVPDDIRNDPDRSPDVEITD